MRALNLKLLVLELSYLSFVGIRGDPTPAPELMGLHLLQMLPQWVWKVVHS